VHNILKQYEITLINLKNKDYHFDFTMDKAFFELFDYSLVENGNLKTNLVLSKSETMIQLFFHIEGTVELICDRSLENFDFPINLQEKMILKYGEHHEQIDDELEIITRQTNIINIAQYMYEFISIAIPMKKLHPKFQEEEWDDEEDSILIYSSETDILEEDSNIDEENIDPRWQALKKLKN
jgi:uncharacterized protein